MSTTGDGDLAPGGQEGPAGAAGVQAGARDGVDRNSEPRRGDSMPEAEAGGVVGASGGPREAALEGGNAQEDSDIGLAEEGEEVEQAEGLNHMVDSRHFPLTGFRLTFLNLVHSMVNRLSDNHFLVPPHDDHVSVQHQNRPRLSNLSSATMARFSEVQVPFEEAPAQEAEQAEEALAQEAEQAEEAEEAEQEEEAQEAEQEEEAQEAEQEEEAQEAKEAEEASLWEMATKESEEPRLWEMPQEPAAREKTAECQDENSKEEAQGTKSEGKEKTYNRKQEQPEKDLDPAEDRPRKPSLED